jgi:hypothetical protein
MTCPPSAPTRKRVRARPHHTRHGEHATARRIAQRRAPFASDASNGKGGGTRTRRDTHLWGGSMESGTGSLRRTAPPMVTWTLRVCGTPLTCARPLHTYMHTMQASFVQVSKVCAGSRRPARNQPQRLVTRARLSDWFSGKNYMADKIGNKVDLNTRDQVQLRLVCGRVSIVRAEAERRRYNSMGFTPELTAGAGGWPLHSRGARGIW